MTDSLTRKLARIVARPVEPVVRERAALHVLDWVGCAVVGAREPAGQLVLKHAARGPSGRYTVVGGRSVGTPEQSAFCNGGLGNILEMDDVHRTAILHPGPVVIPAALAAAESCGATAEVFLNALVRGYEADIRIGSAVGPGHYANWHNTSTCGLFGAAASVGSVLGLNEDQMVWALGNAGTQASGPWRCRHEPVMTKQLHTAHAAQAGYNAAALAELGFTGPEYMLEGEQGFFQAMCPDPLPERILEDPDGPWKVWATSFKPWPACRHAHAAIDAALEARSREQFDPAEITSVTVRTYGDAKRFCDRLDPQSTLEAKFSLQHAVAIVLLAGEPKLADFSTDAISRADVTALRDRVSVQLDSVFDTSYPAHYGSGVDVKLSDGRQITVNVPDALGDPENPLSDDRIVHKAQHLMMAAGLTETAANSMTDATLSLASGGNLARFSALISEISPQLDQDKTE
ncbi:MmgE/PrpD family protein [Hoeflea sp.]|uniref:MmgE/PrpD family protein n=1 Tax=Hoeflea sp. TaxID=1940281 RepID=UPI003B01C6EA